MFVLDKSQFSNSSTSNISQFVGFWSKFYDYTVKETTKKQPIDYFQEISIGKNLTKKNITRLLRWKSPRGLTPNNKKGLNNSKVSLVLKNIKKINKFRNCEISEHKFLEITCQIFSHGWIFRIFLFHIARPFDYPIFDQHVARVHALLSQEDNTEDWDQYLKYRSWYFDLLKQVCQSRARDCGCLLSHKNLDSALMAYGQFLAKYNINFDDLSCD